MNSRHHKQAIENIRCHDGDGAVMSSNASDSVPLEPPQPANWSTYRVPRQRRRKKSTNHYTSGLWSETEQYQFLTGLMLYGWGQWKEIGTIVTTRSNRQIKSHGQKVATKYYNGKDIFQPLINYQSRNKPTVFEYLSTYKYPPKIDSMKPFFDSPIDSQSPAVENEKHESKTLAEILCSMKSRAK